MLTIGNGCLFLMTHETQSWPAPAKLNLWLRVIGRREDGYHLLNTLFHFVTWQDSIHFSVNTTGKITEENPHPLIPMTHNLCFRAARLLQQKTGCSLGVSYRIQKNLPLGGGVGGGSSNAATTLLALNQLWGLNLDRPELQKLGLILGADVPLFIFGQSAYATGLGEILHPVTPPPAWYLVAYPPQGCQTAKIFNDPDLTRNSQPVKIADLVKYIGVNDLQPTVIRHYPIVASLLQWLGRWGVSGMSGSGSCCFVVFNTQEQAKEALALLPPPFQGVVTQGQQYHPLYSCAGVVVS